MRLVTLAEGEIGELHVGLKGTMNALFLKDLARRPIAACAAGSSRAARAAAAATATRWCPVPPDRDGLPERGLRRIEPGRGRDRAADLPGVRRPASRQGDRPRAQPRRASVARRAEPGARARIAGNAARGTGILNNELYIGRLVWNRLRYVKDPSTGKRVSRLNDAWPAGGRRRCPSCGSSTTSCGRRSRRGRAG